VLAPGQPTLRVIGPQPTPTDAKPRLKVRIQGFDLDAQVAFDGRDRKRLERMVRVLDLARTLERAAIEVGGWPRPCRVQHVDERRRCGAFVQAARECATSSSKRGRMTSDA